MKIVERSGRQLLRQVLAVSAVLVGWMIIAWDPVWAAGAEGQGGGGWQTTDWYRVMNFAVLAVGLYFLLRKPASQALNSRITGIVQELEGLEARKKAVEKQLAEYDQRLARMDQEAQAIIAEYQRQGEEARARILKEAEAAAERLKEQARKNIDHEFNQAKLTLQKDVVEKALARAERLIAEKISADDQKRLVDEYLDKVVA